MLRLGFAGLLPRLLFMIRWIVFDDETAEAVMSRFRRGAAEIRFEEPLDAVLALGQPSLLVLPSRTPGRVLLARCTPRSKAQMAKPATPSHYRLVEPTLTRRQPPQGSIPPKRWWQRLGA